MLFEAFMFLPTSELSKPRVRNRSFILGIKRHFSWGIEQAKRTPSLPQWA